MIQTNDDGADDVQQGSSIRLPSAIVLCGTWARTGSQQLGQLEFQTFCSSTGGKRRLQAFF